MPPALQWQQPLRASEGEVDMTIHRSAFAEWARLTWAIAAKDIVEALKNKNTLGCLFSSLFIVVLYRMLPILNARLEPSPVLIYDPGRSTLSVYLENSAAVTAHTGYGTQEAMLQSLARGDVPELGLVIPDGFDRSLEAGNVMPLKGYVAYWLSDSQADKITQSVEAEIIRLLGRPVVLELQAERAYLEPGPNGAGTQAAMALVFVFAMVGVTMVPHLMLEEKQSRTLEVLLTSPASEAQVILAKAIAGVFYCLLAAAVILGINHEFIVHWGLTLLATVCFSFFVVALGLWVGYKVETRAQLSVLIWPIYVPLFGPMIIYLLGDLFPDILTRLIVVIPSATMLVMMTNAFAGWVNWGTCLLGLVWILLCTGAALAATVWLVRRRDREAEGRLRSRKDAAATLAPTAVSAQRLAGDVLGAQGDRAAPRPSEPELSTRKLSMAGTRMTRTPSGIRIFAALVAKDMREAINNRLLLSILLGTAFVVLNGGALPLLIQARMKPTAIVYDEGRSTILRGLDGGDQFVVGLAESRHEMEAAISEGLGTRLGLVLPADFDTQAGSGQVIELDGYFAHWADADEVRQLTALFEEQLGLASGGTVTINLEGHQLYPTAGAGGLIGINLLTMVIAVSTIGIALVPLLLVEEKESHTLEAMLLSPAKPTHIVSAKAAVGATFCLLTFAVVALFNMTWIVHWDVLLLAAVLTVALVVGLGLLVGILADSPTSAAFWGGPLLLLFMASAFTELWVVSGAPAIVQHIATWLPGPLIMNLFRLSAAGEFAATQLWSYAGALVAMAAAIYLLIGWRLRRWGR
jgi:ABC-type Na+ efflux pump permease subunit